MKNNLNFKALIQSISDCYSAFFDKKKKTKLVVLKLSQLLIDKHMGFLNKLFGKEEKGKVNPENESKITAENEFSVEQFNEDYELKEKALEGILGEMYEMVGHAIIPFAVGGAVDMYYFPNHILGTGFATMELLDPYGNGPKPNWLGTYELVAFTKELYNTSGENQTPFNLIERRICGIFTTIGNYSIEAVLNPGDTCEVPRENEENKCLIFDNYSPDDKVFKIGNRVYHLLLCMEIFRNEMEYSRANGNDKLFELLKQAGHYPYSDLNREPVI